MADCEECKLKFSKISNLRSHVKRKHPEKIDTLAPKLTKKVGSHICQKCNDTFSNFGNLRVHIKRKHPEELEELAPIKKRIFKCKICKLDFITLKKMTVHKRVHAAVKKMLKCPLCKHTNTSKENMISHFKVDHSLNIETENLELSFNDFLQWKAKVEKDSFSSYINLHGSGKNPNVKKIMYACHRSGDNKTRGTNIRSLKTLGSNKINAYCPAHMNVLIKEGKCMVTFCKTHVGHKQEEDIGHLFLSESDRRNVAAKIAAQIPLQTILDDIRNTVSDSHLERIHLLTKKDLYNIETSYNLNKTSVRHKNDAVSVDAVNSISSCKNKNEMLLEGKKKLLATLQEQVFGALSLAELGAIRNIVAPIQPTLDAMRNVTNSFPLSTSNNIPSNKKLSLKDDFGQRKKKRRKQTSSVPSNDEEDVIAIQLLNQPSTSSNF